MPLPKKYVVQKSFRIDAKLEKDLEYLSNKLNRPKNELVNLSLERLMWDNRQWFVENVLVDCCEDFFQFDQEHSHCEIGGVIIDIQVNDDCSTTRYFCCKDENGNIIDEDTKIYPDSCNLSDELTEDLQQIALMHLNSNKKDVEQFLKSRLDYK